MGIDHQGQLNILILAILLKKPTLLCGASPQMENQRVQFDKEESDKRSYLEAKQAKELDMFDIDTTAMGLKVQEVGQASLETPDDDISIRGSMLSLSGSSSSNSFSSHTPL